MNFHLQPKQTGFNIFGEKNLEPMFSDFWSLTSKTGRKEMLAKRFNNLPVIRRIAIMESVKNLKSKPDPTEYLK